MPFPQSVQNVAFALLLAALVFSSLLRPRYFLFLAGMVLPFVYPRLAVGVGVDWYKIVGPLALGLLLLSRSRGVGVTASRASWFHWFLAYVIVLSSVWMLLEYNVLQRWRVAAALELGGGVGQTYLKMPVQLGSFLGQALCLYVVPAFARDERDVRSAVAGYASGCGISVGMGLLSMGLSGTGTVARGQERGELSIEAVEVYRLGGLSGEPKFLGACLALLFSFALVGYLLGRPRDKLKASYVLLFTLGAAFLTFSTSTWVGVVGAVAVTGLFALRKISVARATGAIVVVGALVALGSTVAFVGAAVEQRLMLRLEQKVLRKQKDAYVLYLYRDQPLNAVFGYGLGGGDLAVIPYIDWLHLKYKRTPTPGITVMRLWADLGTVGLLILGGLSLAWHRRLLKRGDPEGAVFIPAGLAAALPCGAIGLSAYFFLAGAALARCEVRAAARRRALTADTRAQVRSKPEPSPSIPALPARS